MEKIPVDTHPAVIIQIVPRNVKQSIHVYVYSRVHKSRLVCSQGSVAGKLCMLSFEFTCCL